MNQFLLLAADTASTASTTNGSSGGNILIFVLEFGVLGLLLYFLLIRPQKKQQKAAQAMLSTVAAGDSVLTSSGMYGVVIDVMEDVVIIEFGNNKNCRIPMKKSSIVEIEKPSLEKEKDKDTEKK